MQHTPQGQLYTDIVLEVFKLGGLLISDGDQLSKDIGLTSARWKVLGALANSGTPMTVSQIAFSMGQTRQGVQRLSDAMVKAKLLAYEENPRHKTAKLVALTEKGSDAFAALEQKQIPWANAKSSGIELKEMEVALEVLKKITQVLRD